MMESRICPGVNQGVSYTPSKNTYQRSVLCPVCERRVPIKDANPLTTTARQGLPQTSSLRAPIWKLDHHMQHTLRFCDCGQAIWDNSDYVCADCRAKMQ